MSLESFKATNRLSSEGKSDQHRKEMSTLGLLRKLKPIEMRGTPERNQKDRSQLYSELAKISVTKDRNLSGKKKEEVKDDTITPATTDNRDSANMSYVNLKSLHMSRLPSETSSDQLSGEEGQ